MEMIINGINTSIEKEAQNIEDISSQSKRLEEQSKILKQNTSSYQI